MKLYRRLMRLIARTCEEERQDFRREIAHLNATTDDMHRTIITDTASIRDAVRAITASAPPKILP